MANVIKAKFFFCVGMVGWVFRWTINRSAVRPKKVVKSSSTDHPLAPTSRPSLRVLLVDDNVVNQKLGLRMLQHMGYRAETVGNGIEALAAMHRTAYHVVLMSIHMLEMDGLEATRRIRSEFSFEDQPTIIAMTASASKADRARYLLAGMDDYLPKPLRMEDLASVLAKNKVGPQPGTGAETSADAGYGKPPNQTHPLLVPPSNPASSPTPAPVYDSDVLATLASELGDDGVGVRTDLIEAYLKDSTSELEALTAAREDASGEILRYTAHALRSASAALGLMALSSTATDIETALRTSPQDVDVALDATQLTREYQQATAALRAALQDIAEGPASSRIAEPGQSVPVDLLNGLTESEGGEHPALETDSTPASSHLMETPVVLLVDDDAVSRKICVAHLTKMGYRVELAVNGSDALEALHNRHYAAVLMDCGMPVMDGYDTTRVLRRREGNERHTPVIALTGADTAPDHVRCAASGMDEYLTKPVNFLKLTVVLQYWVHGIGVRTTSMPLGAGSWNATTPVSVAKPQ